MLPAERSRSSTDTSPAVTGGQAGPPLERGPRHLEVEPGAQRGGAAVAAVPVAHHDAVEPPLAAEHVAEQPRVLRAERAVEPVVGGHHAAHSGPSHGRLERREVHLAHRLLVDLGRDRRPLDLGVVGDEVLDAGGDAGALDAVDVGDGGLGVSTGSSLKNSKLRPPIGVRWRLTVGPSRTLTPRAMHSRARAARSRRRAPGRTSPPAPHRTGTRTTAGRSTTCPGRRRARRTCGSPAAAGRRAAPCARRRHRPSA